MQLEILGNAEMISAQNGVLVINTPQAEARITVYSPTIIRVCITKNSEPDASFAVIQDQEELPPYQDSANEIEINTGALKLVINKSPLRFNFFNAEGQELSQDDIRFGTNWQDSRV